MDKIMLILAATLLAADFGVRKIFSNRYGSGPETALKFNAISGLIKAILFFVINGFKFGFTPYSFLMAALLNCLVMSYTVIGFKLFTFSSVAMYTLFLMAGGMTVPYIWGLLFLDEPLTFAAFLGLVLILSGTILSNYEKSKPNFKQIILCISVFVLNGFVSVISKLHQIENTFSVVNTYEFIILGGLFTFIFAGILSLVFKKKASVTAKSNAGMSLVIIILCSAAFDGISYFLQLFGASSLPATVLYPFITGGSIVMSAIVSRFFFKEKLSKRFVISIILCFVGTVMFI